jgi:hypothetical protein
VEICAPLYRIGNSTKKEKDVKVFSAFRDSVVYLIGGKLLFWGFRAHSKRSRKKAPLNKRRKNKGFLKKGQKPLRNKNRSPKKVALETLRPKKKINRDIEDRLKKMRK